MAACDEREPLPPAPRGFGFTFANVVADQIGADPGYGDLLRVAHQTSAAASPCLLVRKQDYLALGSFNEVAFPERFASVDFCLRLRAAGRRIVVTPHARLTHHGSVDRGDTRSPSSPAHSQRETDELRRRWGDKLAADPHYSPLLNLDTLPYTGLAWPPRLTTRG